MGVVMTTIAVAVGWSVKFLKTHITQGSVATLLGVVGSLTTTLL